VTSLSPLPEVSGVLGPLQVAATAEAIAEVQLPSGMVPWFPGGHSDPWNHVEAAMAMDVGGLHCEAERAYQWLVDSQHADGSWCMYYLTVGVEQPRRDANVAAYVAAGTWHHYLVTADWGFLEEMWPVVSRAIEFVLRLQQPGGEILWSVEPDGTPGRYALLTGSSSMYFSLRCAVAVAEALGYERPDWELAAGRLAHAISYSAGSFEPKHRWAMDWYYPVLCGAVRGEAGESRLDERWSEFVMPGLGVRCVSDRPWVTAAETAECVMALDSLGRREEAHRLFEWAQALRHDDGSYWTGWVHPERVHFPGNERTTYTAAAVVLAADTLAGTGAASAFFRGEGLPAGLDLSEPVASEPLVDPDRP
jgi:hypothetical protein